MLGELQHLALDLDVRHVGERLFGGAHFVVEVERRRGEAPGVSPDQQRPSPPEEDRLSDRRRGRRQWDSMENDGMSSGNSKAGRAQETNEYLNSLSRRSSVIG